MNESKVSYFWSKVKRRANAVKEYILPFLAGATIGAAWYGYVSGIRNGVEIDKLEERVKKDELITANVVNNNANIQIEDRKRLDALERQNNLLFERALKETEGKAD